MFQLVFLFAWIFIAAIDCQSKMNAENQNYHQRWIQNSVGRPYAKAHETLINRVIKKVSDMDVNANETLIRTMAYGLKCSFENIDRDLKKANQGSQPIRKSLESQEMLLVRQLKFQEEQVTTAEKTLAEAKKNLESTQKLIDESKKAVEESKKGAEDAENRFRLALAANEKNDNCEKRRKKRSFSMCSLFGYWSVRGTENVHQRLSMAFQQKHQSDYRLVQQKQVEFSQRARYNQAETKFNLVSKQFNETKSKLAPIQETQKQLAEFTNNVKNVETFIGEVFGASNVLKEELINLFDFQNIIEPLLEIYDKMAKDKLLETTKIVIIQPTEEKFSETTEKLKNLLNTSWDLIDNDPKQIKPHCASMRDV